jgi:hypothetical protein
LKISYQLAAAIFYGYGNDDGVCWNDNARWILPLPGDGLSRSAWGCLTLRLRPGVTRKDKQEERT